MDVARPAIGLIAAYTPALPDYYRHALEPLGVEVRMLPRVEPRYASSQLAGLDGLLIPGGGDVHARFYGSALSPLAAEVDERRDRHEISLIREAVDRGLPLLGICRGHQVVNVALGGTLCQDLAREWGRPTIRHRAVRWAPDRFHPVRVDLASEAVRAAGREEIVVNSHHHQAVAELAPCLRAVAHADDGIVEAYDFPGRPLLGVQWHPERLDRSAWWPLETLRDWARGGRAP